MPEDLLNDMLSSPLLSVAFSIALLFAAIHLMLVVARRARDGNYGLGRSVRYIDVKRPAEASAPLIDAEDVIAAHSAVDDIKARVGELRSDPAWVILHPAFFDAQVAESARLFEALHAWNQHRDHWTDRDVVQASRDLVRAFSAARQHARQVGTRYYDDTRASARAASRAQRLAVKAASASGPERDALMSKCANLLVDLLPYRLPATQALPPGR